MKHIMRAMIQTLAAAGILMGLFAVGFAQQRLIDDFTSNPKQNWRFFADTVMGGVSSGGVTFKTEEGVSFAQLSGKVSTANNGGFIQIRKSLNAAPSAETKGIRLIVRGNGERYFIHLRTSGTLLPWQYYQAGFATSSKWREIMLPFSAFKASSNLLRNMPKAASLKSVAVVAFGKDYDADVQVREIGFY